MAAPHSCQPLSNTETRSRVKPPETPNGSTNCGPSLSLYCLTLSSLKKAKTGRDKASRAQAQLEPFTKQAETSGKLTIPRCYLVSQGLNGEPLIHSVSIMLIVHKHLYGLLHILSTIHQCNLHRTGMSLQVSAIWSEKSSFRKAVTQSKPHVLAAVKNTLEFNLEKCGGFRITLYND